MQTGSAILGWDLRLVICLLAWVGATAPALAQEDRDQDGEPASESGTDDETEPWKKRLWAEEDVAAPDAVTVVVTAERADQAVDDAASAVSAVGAGQIEQLAPADVTQVIEQVPGVDVQRMSPAGYGANVSIRGSSDFKPGGFGNRVLVLLDGRPVNAPDTHGVDWAGLPLFDLDRVEVLRGPASALYGSTAVGGVVQLFTRAPEPGAAVLLGQGFTDRQPNQTRLAASLSDAGESWGLRLSGWLQRYAGLAPPGLSALRHNSDSFRDGVRLTGFVAPAADHRLTAELAYLQSSGGNPGFEGTTLASRSRRFQRDSLATRLGWTWDPAGSLRVESDLYWSRSDSLVSDPDGGNPNAYDTDRLGLRSLASFLLWDRLVNTAGAEFEFQRVVGDVYDLGDGPYSLVTGALFLQSILELGAGFELTAGLRFDGFSYSTHQRYSSLSPKLRVAWRPDDQTVVWVAANRGFRAPSIGELYLLYEASFGLTFQGNPRLDPEVLWAFEAGARRSFADGKLKLVGVGFWNEGSDTIEFDYRELPVSALNLAGSRTFGAELSVVAAPVEHVRIDGSLTWLRARSLPDGRALLYRPDFKGRLRASLHGRGLELWAQLMGVGQRRYDDFLEGDVMGVPRRSLGPYLLVDLGAGWRGPWGLTLRATVRNLLDTDHRVIQDYPPPGREFLLELIGRTG